MVYAYLPNLQKKKETETIIDFYKLVLQNKYPLKQ